MFKTTWQKAALAGAAMAALGACATSTPYEAAGQNRGYGFTDQKIEDDRYRITFRGNSVTDRETVETYLLYRAAEVTLQNGYDYFVVVEDDTERSTNYTGFGGSAFGPGFFGPGFGPGFYGPGFYGRGAFYGGFPYYGYGFPWGAGFNDVNIRERNRYTAVAYIVMGRGEKPEDTLTAYDARQVEQNLAPRIQVAAD